MFRIGNRYRGHSSILNQIILEDIAKSDVIGYIVGIVSVGVEIYQESLRNNKSKQN